MIDVYALIDSATKRANLPELDVKVRCSDHPAAAPLDGFGLAGGGFGAYTYCSECGKVLTKSEVQD